jgi:calcium-dependent protein kinase
MNGYTLHQKIGEGGYSVVRKCTDDIGVRYACKIVPKKQSNRPRVMHEVRVMERVRGSPKLVQLIDAGEDAANFYIVQEWCRGGSVQDYIRKHGDYGENTVASIIRGTLRGLCHMHDRGIIHADVKCGNIFFGDLSADADIKLGDFGTALYMPDDGGFAEVGKLVGTPWYMAPENLRYTYHATSDVWSIGVVAYQLLCGFFPFDGKVINRIWAGILERDPTYAVDVWQNVSTDAKDFVQLCLQKDYTARPSARECLNHPWLTRTDCSDRFKGTQLMYEKFVFKNDAAMTIHM